MIHSDPHPKAGQTVTVDLGQGPQEYRLEDWWDRVSGSSWMYAEGHLACLAYAIRTAGITPIDDEVVYGKCGGIGHLAHVSEIKEED
ncbi:hypothetical protein DEJ49_33175 [Streptomyces venezuelae]|uniref:Uncharacterized protein n=1 Tax=Streptomyces venezuelae TaxID=54571 RepID=A0A5P2CQS2_STRVZ|nr:hypothetical protein [Streptomyces venezuelae]QES45195.1 hypothetical protein DEJ49_33175 [Streptomyces venezuelae]